MRLILSDDVCGFFYSRLKKQQQPFALLSCEIMAIISLCVQSPIIMDVKVARTLRAFSKSLLRKFSALVGNLTVIHTCFHICSHEKSGWLDDAMSSNIISPFSCHHDLIVIYHIQSVPC